jgi:hypothetical protein
MKKFIMTTILVLALASAQAGLVSLNFVNVGAPAINCVFDPSCITPVFDTTAPIYFPGWSTNAGFFLQSRTSTGSKGSPAAALRLRISDRPEHRSRLQRAWRNPALCMYLCGHDRLWSHRSDGLRWQRHAVFGVLRHGRRAWCHCPQLSVSRRFTSHFHFRGGG